MNYCRRSLPLHMQILLIGVKTSACMCLCVVFRKPCPLSGWVCVWVIGLGDDAAAWFECFSQSRLSPLRTSMVTWVNFKMSFQIRSLLPALMVIAKLVIADSWSVLGGQKWVIGQICTVPRRITEDCGEMGSFRLVARLRLESINSHCYNTVTDLASMDLFSYL